MNKKVKIGFWIFIVVLGALFAYGVKNTTNFFETSVSTFITVSAAVFVTFFLTQSKNDDRNTKDLVFKVIDQIQEFSHEAKSVNFQSIPDQKDMLLQIRRMRSKTHLLNLYSERYHYQTASKELLDYFEKYQELFDNHFQDLDYLQKSDQEIARWMENIDTRCDSIRIKLYPPK